MIMGVGVQGLSDASSLMIFIFLNAGLVKIEEAGTIEDENQEHQNNKTDISKRQGHQWPCFFYAIC